MSKKIQVIYVAGLYHSGTTLLDLIMSGQDEVVGLGEIYKQYFDGPEEKCSCGKLVVDCEFWSSKLDASTVQDFYGAVLNRFKEIYPNKILLDSSKCHPVPFGKIKPFKGLDILQDCSEQCELKVIHIVRDPRSWVSNIIRRKKRFLEDDQFRWWQNLYNNRLVRCMQWIYGHNKIREYLKKNRISHVTITYEELVKDPILTLSVIREKLDLDINRITVSLDNDSGSHILVGNPWRHKRQLASINYDQRWLADKPSIVEAIVLRLFWRNIEQLKVNEN